MSQREGLRAVVGVDLSPCGDEAIAEGLRFLTGADDHVLHLVHVFDPRALEESEQPGLRTQEEALARAPTFLRERLEQVAALYGLLHSRERVRTHARVGKVSACILEVAQDCEADLIIVGSHQRRGIDRLMLGSVAEKVMRGARCPVLVARRKTYGHDPHQGSGKTPRAACG
jgi:nucleotide-binding universal stress UspA family protein